MNLEEQQRVLQLWIEFLADRRPTGRLIREFYFEVVSGSPGYRYGMAPELVDLILNGEFELSRCTLWTAPLRLADDHQAA
jgi:hypothetical protein